MERPDSVPPVVARHLTALRRIELSRPLRFALQDSLLSTETSLLDYGCGQGDDIRLLRDQAISCTGWDPFFSPSTERCSADIVNLGYVVNVIESANERMQTLREAWSLARKLLIVSARLTVEVDNAIDAPYGDGYLTRRGTFQKLFEQSELKNWIDSVLAESCIAAAPGVFYVFRDPELKYRYQSSHIRRVSTRPKLHRSVAIFEENRELFEPLIEFVVERGRIPAEQELTSAPLLRQKLGSIRRAFAIVRQMTGVAHWERIRAERAEDLLVYLALSRFSKRPRFGILPFSLQLDLRAFFTNYKRACAFADELLFSAGNLSHVESACRKSPLGKLTPSALYIHETALSSLDPILRVYEGCARTLTGSIDNANVIKLHFREPMVSYLSYLNFETDAHPALARSVGVHLQTFRMGYRHYVDSPNPPILHRKESFVRLDDASRLKYERLTRQEESKLLYENTSEIGTKQGWERILAAKGLRIAGHRVLRAQHSDLAKTGARD